MEAAHRSAASTTTASTWGSPTSTPTSRRAPKQGLVDAKVARIATIDFVVNPSKLDRAGQDRRSVMPRDGSAGPAQGVLCAPAMALSTLLARPLLLALVGVLDQRRGRHLLVLEQIGRPDLHGFGLTPCGKHDSVVLEHLGIDVHGCAQQRAERWEGTELDVREVSLQLLFGSEPGMAVVHRVLNEMHVEATR